MRYVSVALLLTSSLVVGCGGGEPAAEDYPDAVTADPDHYAVEFENDAVRILRITYGPGEESVMHEHPETCSISLSADAAWSMEDPNGTVTEDDPAMVGEVNCGIEPGVHLPRNAGTVANEVILIEFEEGAAPGVAAAGEHPGAVAADPDHYAVEFENEAVRVLRVGYGAGERSVMHYHPANCYVPLHSGTWHMEDPAGEVMEVGTTFGEVVCGDAGSHRPANASGEAGQAVVIEFKGRATVE